MANLHPDPQGHRHPSNVLYNYGDPESPLMEGDFGDAMRYVIKAAEYEKTIWSRANGNDLDPDNELVNMMTLLAAHATEALAIWRSHHGAVSFPATFDAAREPTIHDLRGQARYDRDHGNKPRAENFTMFADALESGDFQHLAF